MLKKVQAQDTVFRFGYLGARDALLDDLGESVEVYKLYNITNLPLLLIYQAGPKTVKSALTIQAQVVSSLMGAGPKRFYESMKQFVPSLVDAVHSKSLADRLVKEQPLLPRV